MDTAQIHVYRQVDRYVIGALDRTITGVWISTPRVITLSLGATHGELGAAALRSLDDSQVNIPHPDFRSVPPRDQALWRAAGVRSRRRFMKDTYLCSLQRHNSTLTLIPAVNGGVSGPGRGWTPMEEAASVQSANEEPAALGRVIFKVLAKGSASEFLY